MTETDEQHTPDTLADKLDALLPPGQYNSVMVNDDPLIDAASWLTSLASAAPPRMSDDVLKRIEAQVLKASYPAKVIRPKFWNLPRLGLVASFALVFMVAGAASASLGSIPGDSLYPLKQAVEGLERSFAFSAEARASVYLNQADRRVIESVKLVRNGQDNLGSMLAAYENMVTAARISNETANFDVVVREQLIQRTVDLDAQLGSMLIIEVPSISEASLEVVEIYATQVHTEILLPPTVEPSVTPSTEPTSTATVSLTPTLVPTASPSSTATATETATETLAPTATLVAPSLTPTATVLPINLIIEGPITSVNGNVIIIYDIPIVLSPDDPLLDIVRPGDVIRVDGNIQEGGLDTPVTAVDTAPADDGLVVNDNGESWRDSGDCSNPPPNWAPAGGWRARCEAAEQPGNSNGQGQGSENSNAGGNGQGQGSGNNNAGGNSQGQGNGQGQGSGNSNAGGQGNKGNND